MIKWPQMVGASVMPFILGASDPRASSVTSGRVHYEPPSDQLHLAWGPAPEKSSSEIRLQPLELRATTESQLNVPISLQNKALDMQEERRLNELIVKKALEKITQSEYEELVQLDLRRSVDEPSPTPESIERRERILAKIEDLIQELSTNRRPRY